MSNRNTQPNITYPANLKRLEGVLSLLANCARALFRRLISLTQPKD